MKDKDEMLAFYDYPAEYWMHRRPSNPIESTFTAVRLRTHKVNSCGDQTTTFMMVFKLAQLTEKNGTAYED